MATTTTKPARRQAHAVEFPRRAQIVPSDVGRRRIYTSKCGRFRIVQTLYDCKALAPRWYALRLDPTACGGRGCWDKAGPHRYHTSKRTAWDACNQDAACVMRLIREEIATGKYPPASA